VDTIHSIDWAAWTTMAKSSKGISVSRSRLLQRGWPGRSIRRNPGEYPPKPWNETTGERGPGREIASQEPSSEASYGPLNRGMLGNFDAYRPPRQEIL